MVTNQKATTIKERYSKGYITSAQLIRYLELGVITQEEYQNIQNRFTGNPMRYFMGYCRIW